MKVNCKASLLAMLLLASAGLSQAQATGAAPAPTKTGVLNVRNAILGTAEGKQAAAELQSQFNPRQTEIENLQKQINDLRSRLQAGERTLSDEEKGRLQREGERLTKKLQRTNEDLQEDLNDAQSVVINRIGQKLVDVVDRYARENGFAVVIDTSAQSSPVIYANQGIDITQDIIRLYDQANPVRSGAAAPAQPGQTRPAQPPAAQPGTPRPPQQNPPPKPPPQ